MQHDIRGNSLGALSELTRRAIEERAAEHVASAVTRTEMRFRDKLARASAEASAAMRAEKLLKTRVERAMAAVYELTCWSRPDPAKDRKPSHSDARAGPWLAEAAERESAELVGLFLGGLLKPDGVRVCAKLLRLARHQKVEPKDFHRFLRSAGAVDVSTRVVETGPDAASPRRRPKGGRR
jgi:hypothetical protein